MPTTAECALSLFINHNYDYDKLCTIYIPEKSGILFYVRITLSNYQHRSPGLYEIFYLVADENEIVDLVRVMQSSKASRLELILTSKISIAVLR